ncbi:MAG: hypothetical protein ABTQ26_13255 [Azonexus sp.]
MIDLVKYAVAFLIPVACALRWAGENGHKPTKVIPFLIGYVTFIAVTYFVVQKFFATPSYIEIANHEAILEMLVGWIIVAIFAGLCFLFILRMLMKSQGLHIKESE